MKRTAIREQVENHLAAVGFAPDAWTWSSANAELLIAVGNVLRHIKLKSGISKRALTYELGRIAGMAEALGITPQEQPA